MNINRLKPETIERLKRERVESAQTRRADLIERLTCKAQQSGPDSIYAELLADVLREAV